MQACLSGRPSVLHALLAQATGDLTPLARFMVRNLWVAFTSMRDRSMSLRLSLPWVEGEDQRPWVPREHALVISSADSASDAARTPASLLTMEWQATAELARQKLQVRAMPVIAHISEGSIQSVAPSGACTAADMLSTVSVIHAVHSCCMASAFGRPSHDLLRGGLMCHAATATSCVVWAVHAS